MLRAEYIDFFVESRLLSSFGAYFLLRQLILLISA